MYVRRGKEIVLRNRLRGSIFIQSNRKSRSADIPKTPPAKANVYRAAREPHPETDTPEKWSNVQHIKRPGAWTPQSCRSRGKEQTIRERPAVTPAHDLPPRPQEQARQAFVEKQAQLSQNPSIESIYPSEPAAPSSTAAACFGSARDHAGSVSRSRLAAAKSAPPVQPSSHRSKSHQWSRPRHP